MSDTIKITKSDLDEKNCYIGKADVSETTSEIEIDANLGTVYFRGRIKTTRSILALSGSGISAWWGISAGGGISAGSGISAGWGISAGLTIIAKYISSKLRIFAGICRWRIPEDSETEIRAEKVEGKVCFGKVVIVEPSAREADAALVAAPCVHGAGRQSGQR